MDQLIAGQKGYWGSKVYLNNVWGQFNMHNF